MADQPRRGGRLPEGRTTLPIGATVDVSDRSVKVTPPRGNPAESLDGRTTSPMAAQKALPPAVESGASKTPTLDEPTRTVLPTDKQKFVDPSDPRVRTAIHPTRTARDVAVQPRAEPRDWLLPDARASEAPAPAAPAVEAARVEPREVEKTKIWVATHKPPVDPDPRLILLREPDSERAASFRVLRHRLQQKGDPRTIAVTSAEDGEGKTTCAANLAMALGECDRAKVLLVEANLRNPSLAALFGFLPPTCFSLQLTQHKEKPLDPWSVVEAFSPSLHVIAVKPGQEARPLLDGPAFGHAMHMLKHAGYDYIVLDTPAVLGSADVNLVEDSCDGILLTGWARKTSGRALRRAVDQLAPSKILGITLLDA